MHQSAVYSIPSVGEGLSQYLTQIRRFPILTQEEETSFDKRWRQNGDREAAYRLVTSHLRLIAKIAMRYRGYGLPIADIVSEGNVGLMHAVKRFDPDRGVRLATYAMWWIKATIKDYAAVLVDGEDLGRTGAEKAALQIETSKKRDRSV